MASKVSNDAFKLIFPRYAELLSQESVPVNQSIQVFLRDELPRKVEMVRSMQSCFNAFLTHFTNLILKRPQHAHLIHSLSLKANDKIQKYFQSLSMAAHKLDNNSIKDRIPTVDIQSLKRQFKSKLESTNGLLKEKYFGGGMLQRECEQEVAMRLYVLLEIYYFFKSDPVAMAGKFKIKQEDVLWAISRNEQPGEIGSLITLDPNFIISIEETVMKRCRPFINRKELLQSKVRQTLREGQSKVGPNLNLLIQSLISKERGRVGRQLSNSLTRELRALQQGEQEAQVRDLISETETLKRQFAQLKNTTYFMDMIRGTFSQKYKMEVHRLQNVFYLTNLQKYLQDVSTFLEKVLSIEERIIKNRKDYMRDFGNKVQVKISDLISYYQGKPSGLALHEIIMQQFDQLQSALYGVVSKQPVQNVDDYKKRQQRQKRQADRKYQMQRRAEEERQRRQEEKYKIEQKRRKEQQKIKQARIQREQKDRQRKQEADRQQQERRIQLQRKREQKVKKDEEARKLRQEQLRKKEQQRKIRQAEEKNKREDMNKKKNEEQQKRRLEKEEENRKRELQRKKILEREQQEKKKRQLDLKDKKQRQEQERIRRQNERKSEEERIKREKEQRQAQIRKKEEQRIKAQKQRRQKQQRDAQERRKEQERMKQEKQKRDRQLKEAEEKRKQQQRNQREKREQEQKEKRERQKRQRQTQELKKQEERRKEQQRIRLEKERKEKQLKQQKERQKKAQQEKIAKERQQKRKREQQQKARAQKEKRDRQQRQRLERQKAEKERQEKERAEKEKKQRLQKQRLEKQKAQREKAQREKAQRQKRQRQQKKLRQEEQRKKQQEKQRLQRERKEKERRQAQQKARLQKQKRQRQQLEKKAQMQRLKKMEEEAKSKNKGKQQAKKSSGINYGDFDDIMDDDLEQMQKAGKGSPSGINSNVNEDEYGDDFDQQSPHKQDQISTKQLISEADIKCLNDYMKGTSYARKNKVNAELLNKASKYIQVFQELIQNRKLFIFDSALSKALLDLGGQLQNPDTPEDDLRMSVQTIRQEMLKAYDQLVPGQQMFPITRYVFTFPFQNQFNIKLLELIPNHTYFKVVFNEPLPENEQIGQKFQCVIQGLLHIFELEGEPNLEEYVVNEQSRLVLDTFERQLPCLLLLFALHYQRNSTKDILINQYTIQRFFYTSNVIEPFYEAIKEQEQISQFFNKLSEKYSTNDKIKIHNIAVNSSDQQYSQQLTHSSLAIKEQFKKSKQATYLTCFCIQIEEEGEISDKITVYMSLDKASPKINVNYFLVSKDHEQQENTSIIFELISEGDQDLEVSVFTDFTRHNGLGSYSDWTLPLWAHVITKRKLSSLQAFRAIAFAMTPYYLSFKEMD